MSGDMSFGLNLSNLLKLGNPSGSPPPTATPQLNKSLLPQQLTTDTFTFSGNVLPQSAAGQLLQIGGVRINLDPSSLHPSTLTTLQNAPEQHWQFPPLTGDLGGE